MFKKIYARIIGKASYCVAAPLGALLAVVLFRLIAVGERDVLTGKLFHEPRYRSIFKNVSAPHKPMSDTK